MELFCKLCLQSIDVTDWDAHISQKQHLQELPHALVITGSFTKEKADTFYEYFSQFGNIRSQNILPNKIEYRFWDARLYSEIIHKEHNCFDEPLSVSWYKKTKSGPQLVSQDAKMKNEKFTYKKIAVINSLKGLPTVNDQLEALKCHLSIFKDKLNYSYKDVHSDLLSIFGPNFQNSKLQVFGSYTTDLVLHNSDINFYLDTTDSKYSTLAIISDLINNNENFLNVVLQSEKVIFEHKKSGILCSLCIKNELPIATSELLKYYLTLNDKLKMLFLVIRLWFDCYDLKTESGFSSYAINLLIIFYLQQRYKLPCVLDLQIDHLVDEIDGWNCCFGPIEFKNDDLNNSTLLDLVKNFFNFYGNFDYFNYVISPFLGRTIGKTKFLEPFQLPESFENLISQRKTLDINSGICIQDFFEHFKNVSFSVPLNIVGKFMAVCRSCSCLMNSGEEDLLYKLFLNKSLNFLNIVNVILEDDFFSKIKMKLLKFALKIFDCEVREVVENTLVFHGKYDFWSERISVLKKLGSDFQDRIDSEIQITSNMQKSNNVSWTVTIVLHFNEESKAVTIELKDGENLPKMHFLHFVNIVFNKCLMDPHHGLEKEIEETVPAEVTSNLETNSKSVERTEVSEENASTGLVSNSIDLEADSVTPNLEANSKSIETEVFEENASTIPITNSVDLEADLEAVPMDIEENVTEVVSSTSENVTSVQLKDFIDHVKTQIKKETDENKQLSIMMNILEQRYCSFQTVIQTIYNELSSLITQKNYKFDISPLSNLGFRSSSAIFCLNITIPATLLKEFLLQVNECVDITIENDSLVTCKKNGVDCYFILKEQNLWIQRNRLLQYYFGLNKKVAHLTMFLQFWMECQALNCDGFFSEYAFCWMVIFYLQQHPYKLPPVQLLQKTVSEVQDGWKCIFNSTSFKSTLLERVSLLELVSGFFKYYTNFDFFHVVISPLAGFIIEKMRFFPPYNLPHCFEGYKEKKIDLDLPPFICIQDPFELSNFMNFGSTLAQAEFVSICRAVTLRLLKKYNVTEILEEVNFAEMCCFVAQKQDPQVVKTKFERILTEIFDCRKNGKGFTLKISQYLEPAAVRLYKRQIIDVSSSWKKARYFVSTVFKKDPQPTEISLEFSVKSGIVEVLCEPDIHGYINIYFSLFNNQLEKLWMIKEAKSSDIQAPIQQLGEFDKLKQEFQKFWKVIETEEKKILHDLNRVLDVSCSVSIYSYNTRLDRNDVNHKIYVKRTALKTVQNSLVRSLNFERIKMHENEIRGRHVATKKSFVITSFNKDVLREKLIKSYAALENCAMLIILLNTWCDVRNLSLIKEYIPMLVIFFLQHAPYNLPSVHNWNEETLKDSNSLECHTLYSLVEGFFDFYRNFDFASYVICPFAGFAIRKVDFVEPYKLPPCLENYVKNKEELNVSAGLDIQCPFDQSQNLSRNITLVDLGEFIYFCNLSWEFLTTTKSLHHFIDDITKKPWLLNFNLNSEAEVRNFKDFCVTFLTRILHTPKKANNSTYCFRGEQNVFQNRVLAEKILLFSEEDSDANKQVAISSVIKKQFPKSCKWELDLSFSVENETQVKVHLSGKFLRKGNNLHYLQHFLYVHLMKANFNKRWMPQHIYKMQALDSFTVESVESQFAVKDKKLIEICNLIRKDLQQLEAVNIEFGCEITNFYISGSEMDIVVDCASLHHLANRLQESIHFSRSNLLGSQITCHHLKTKVTCVITTNRNIVQNYHCIGQYFKFEEKLKTLCIIIKFWANYNALTSGFGISTFSFILMVIFVLQQKPYCLPATITVGDIFKNRKTAALEKATVSDLLLSFFQYFSNFDFMWCAISPFSGQILQKADLPQSDLTFGLYIQDLLNNLNNVCQIPVHISGKFANDCRRAEYNLNKSNYSLKGLMPKTFPDVLRIHFLSHTVKRMEEIYPLLNDIFTRVFKAESTLPAPIHITRLRMNITGHYNIWFKRKFCSKEVKNQTFSSRLDKEAFISSLVVKNGTQKFCWKLLLEVKTAEKVLLIDIRPTDNCWEYGNGYEFCHLLYMLVSEWLPHAPSNVNKKNTFNADARSSKIQSGVEEKCRSSLTKVESNVIAQSQTHQHHTTSNEQSVTNNTKQEQSPNLDAISSLREDLIKNILSETTFVGQITILKDHLQKNQLDNKVTDKICSDLIKRLSHKEINFFGSAVTKLSMNTSDLNIYVKPQKKNIEPNEQLHRAMELISREKTFIKCFISTNNSLQSPVIKCVHKSTKVSCEIYVKNKLVVQNSELLYYYLSLDEKIPTVLTLIYCWAEQNGMKADGRFSKYALNLMVIFYLQQPPYCIPSVRNLQENHPVMLIDGWNCAFAKKNHRSRDLQTVPVYELVLAFFKFYSEFDVFSYVLSPYFGSKVAKTDFLNLTLPENYQFPGNKNLNMSQIMCLQDPFEHSNNILHNVSSEVACGFIALCGNSVSIMQKPGFDTLINLLGPQTWQLKLDICKDSEIKPSKWTELLNALIPKILTLIFACDVKTTFDGRNTKFECRCFLKATQNRAVFSNFDGKNSYARTIERESEITLYILQKCEKQANCFTFSVNLVFNEDSTKVSVFFEGEDRSFYWLYFTMNLETFLKEEMQSSSTTNFEISTINLCSDDKDDTMEIPPSEAQDQNINQIETTASNEFPNIPADAQIASTLEDQDVASLNLINSENENQQICHSDENQNVEENNCSAASTPNIEVQPSVVIPGTSEKSKLEVIHASLNNSTFPEQASFYCEQIMLEKTKFTQNKISIEKDLTKALTNSFTYQGISLVGSWQTEMFIEGSSFDFYVADLKTKKGTETKFNFLRMLQEALLSSGYFNEFQYKVGFVQCHHIKSDFKCKVFHQNNKLCMYRSNLVCHYSSLSPKIKQLILFIKSWAKLNQVESDCNISGYTINLLVIFYCQRIHNIPSLKSLQQEHLLVEGWNIHFSRKCKKRKLQNETLLELVIGFFQFYATFDYFSFVIAPFVGHELDKHCFLKPFDLPDCYDDYLRKDITLNVEAGFCVQDFFNHSLNVSSSTNVGKWAAWCKGVSLFFPNIDRLFYNLMVNTKNLKNELYSFEITKPLHLDFKEWIKVIKKVIFMIIRDVFYCDISKVDQSVINRGQSIIKIGQKFKSGDIDKCVYECVGQMDFLGNRVKILKSCVNNVPKNASSLDRDILVSRYIKNNIETKGSWHLKVELLTIKENASLQISISGDRDIPVIAHYFYTRIVEAVRMLPTPSKKPDTEVLNSLEKPYSTLVKGYFKKTKSQLLRAHFLKFHSSSSRKLYSQGELSVWRVDFDDSRNYLSFITKTHIFWGLKLKVVPLARLSKPISSELFQDSRLRITHNLLKFPTFVEQVKGITHDLKTQVISRNVPLMQKAFNAVLSTENIDFMSHAVSVNMVIDVIDIYFKKSPSFDSELSMLEGIKTLLENDINFSTFTLFSKTNYIHGRHIPTQTICFLQVITEITVKSIELINQYLNLDLKVKQFLVVIKFWAQIYDMIEPSAFQTYQFDLLIVFYLQQKYKLPSVYNLQENEEPVIIDGWNCCYKSVSITSALQDAKLQDMIYGFFEFYSKFDYITNAICPYFGSPVSKTAFLKPFSLPACFEQFIQKDEDLEMDVGICILDLFDHSNCFSIPLEISGKFAFLCKNAVQIMSHSREQNILYELFVNSETECPTFIFHKPESQDEVGWMAAFKHELKCAVLSLGYLFANTIEPAENKQLSHCKKNYNVWKNRVRTMKTFETDKVLQTTKEVFFTQSVINQSPEEEVADLFVGLKFQDGSCTVKLDNAIASLNIFHESHFLYTRLIKAFEEKKVIRNSNEVLNKDTTKPSCSSSTEVSEQTSNSSDLCSDEFLSGFNFEGSFKEFSALLIKRKLSEYDKPKAKRRKLNKLSISSSSENKRKRTSNESQSPPGKFKKVYSEKNDLRTDNVTNEMFNSDSDDDCIIVGDAINMPLPNVEIKTQTALLNHTVKQNKGNN